MKSQSTAPAGRRLQQRWLNLVLHTTAFIQRCKQELLITHAFGAFLTVLLLIAAELFLGFISIPLYLTSSSNVVGSEDAVEYRIRRIATLTILVSLLALWLLKLIFGLTAFFAESRLYSIEETRQNGAIQTMIPDIIVLPVDARLEAPVIVSVSQDNADAVMMQGTAQPDKTVVLSLERIGSGGNGQLTLYVGMSDAHGHWLVTEDHGRSLLKPATFSVTATLYDQNRTVRSIASAPVTFVLKPDVWNAVTGKVDTILNILMVVFVVLGVLVTVLTV